MQLPRKPDKIPFHMQLQGFQCYQDVSLDLPPPAFTEVSGDQEVFLAELELNTAGALIGAFATFPTSAVWLGMGYTEFT